VELLVIILAVLYLKHGPSGSREWMAFRNKYLWAPLRRVTTSKTSRKD